MNSFTSETVRRLQGMDVGNTPLVELPRSLCSVLRLPKSVTVAYKDETRNPHGSLKDRAANGMLLDGVLTGRIGKQTTIVEASSGNTAKALAYQASEIGLRTLFFVPESTCKEKVDLIEAVDLASVIKVAGGSEDARHEAKVFVHDFSATSDLFLLDQYNNPANLEVHVRSTGPEIWRQSSGRVTHVIAGVGTGATATGLARYFRDLSVEVLGVQPTRSTHRLDGLKYLPGVAAEMYPANACTDEFSDSFYISDDEAHHMVQMMYEHGLLFGPSSGAVLAGAIQLARRINRGAECFIVLVFADSLNLYKAKYPYLCRSEPRKISACLD